MTRLAGRIRWLEHGGDRRKSLWRCLVVMRIGEAGSIMLIQSNVEDQRRSGAESAASDSWWEEGICAKQPCTMNLP